MRTNQRENFENDIINFLPIKFDLFYRIHWNIFNQIIKFVEKISKFARGAHTHLTNKHFFNSKSWQMISWLFCLFYVGLFHSIWHTLKIKRFLSDKLSSSILWLKRLDTNVFFFQWSVEYTSIENWKFASIFHIISITMCVERSNFWEFLPHCSYYHQPFEIGRPGASCFFLIVCVINHMWHWTHNIVFFPFLLFAFFYSCYRNN